MTDIIGADNNIVDASGNSLTGPSIGDRVASIEQAIPEIINAVVNLQKAVVKLNSMLNVLVTAPSGVVLDAQTSADNEGKE